MTWDGYHPRVQKMLADANLLFPTWPEEYGGQNRDAYDFMVLREEYFNAGWTVTPVGVTACVLIEAVGIGRDGKKHAFSNADMKFSYRNSGVDAAIIFTSARFRGQVATAAAIRARMNEVQNHRETAQPIREKTGGSTFKNPPGQSAWKLIDAAGCRGLRLGGAQVSEMHCNFLINTGSSTARDIESLGEAVRKRVKDHSGIELHWEIKRIGIEQS